jgi:hypothetical protein
MSSQESHPRNPDIHEQRTASAEHRIEEHLRSHPHHLAPVYSELASLRKMEGRHFHQDLLAINRTLEEHKILPHMHIVERGKKDFGLVADESTAPPHQTMRGFNPKEHPVAATLPQADLDTFMHSVHRGIGSGPRAHHFASNGGFGEIPSHPSGHFRANGDSPSRTGFAQALLAKLGLPVTPDNLAFLDAWQKAEGGSDDNPFNTSQKWQGATIFNGDGVKRYASMEDGVEATAKTLRYGRYRGIVEALREGNNAHQAAVALANTAWGTGDSVARMV